MLDSSCPYIGQSDWHRASEAGNVIRQKAPAKIASLALECLIVFPKFDVQYFFKVIFPCAQRDKSN